MVYRFGVLALFRGRLMSGEFEKPKTQKLTHTIMKTKSFICSALLLLGAGVATTSCEDILEAENKLVTTDFAPNDTVYQFFGVVHAMQGVVDQSVLLGELRADLVAVNATASEDLQALGNNNVTVDNAYNNPAAFYNVINNCNIFLANVDSTLTSKGESYYEREIIAVKTYRAWAYLELAKIYGSVPFVTEPVLEANAAEQIVADQNNRVNMEQICTYFINDLLSCNTSWNRNNDLLPDYGYDNICFPLRVMLGELYLYRGSFTGKTSDFVEAVRHYHDFLTFTDEERPIGYNTVEWESSNWRSWTSYSTSNTYSLVTGIPMDSISYYGGTYSNLLSVFNSTPGNNYYAAVSPSEHLLEISNAQPYTLQVFNETSGLPIDTLVGHPTIDEILGSGSLSMGSSSSSSSSETTARRRFGDLRYSDCCYFYSESDEYNANLATSRQTISKYTTSGLSSSVKTDERLSVVNLMRLSTVYHHLCEALNRAGFPETAFVLLKYGLSNTTLSKYVSDDEYSRLGDIVSMGFSSTANYWNSNEFLTPDLFPNQNSTVTITSGSTSTQYSRPNQIGLFAAGSGDVDCNPNFYLPTDSSGIVEVPVDTFNTSNLLTYEDSLAHHELLIKIDEAKEHNAEWLASDEVRAKRQAAVDSILINENALETAFEGTRFYDLMRYSKYYNYNYLGEAVSKRNGSSSAAAATITESNGWYLPLPTK